MRSTLQHIQIASYLERGIKDTIHGTLQANRDLDDPDRLQTKMEADLSMFAFGAQLHALNFLSRLDQIAILNGMKGRKDLGISRLPWIPKVNKDGSTSYIAEDGDNALTLQEQYGLSKKSAIALYSKMKNGVISGQDVMDENPYKLRAKNLSYRGDILALDLNSKQGKNSQRRFDQFIFARDHSNSKGGFAFLSTEYYSNTKYKDMISGRASLNIDGEKLGVIYNIPLYRSATFDGSNTATGLANSPIRPKPTSGRSFPNQANLEFPLYHPESGKRMGDYTIYINDDDSNKIMERLSKKFTEYNYSRIPKGFKNK